MKSANGLFLILPALLGAYAFAHEAGAPPGTTGALGQPTCATAGCHDSYPVNSGPGHLSVTEIFSGIETTLVEIRMVGTPGTRWGFQASLRMPYNAYDLRAHLVDTERTQLTQAGDTQYVSHTLVGAQVGPSDSLPTWAFGVSSDFAYFDGTCPYVFVASVSADGDGTPAGDHVYTAIEFAYGHLCECHVWTWGAGMGDLNLSYTVTSADIIQLVAMTFKGAPLPELCVVADVNCDGAITAADLIRMVNRVFKAGPYFCDGCLFSPLVFGDLYCQ